MNVSCLEKAINIKSIKLIYYSRNDSQQVVKEPLCYTLIGSNQQTSY